MIQRSPQEGTGAAKIKQEDFSLSLFLLLDLQGGRVALLIAD